MKDFIKHNDSQGLGDLLLPVLLKGPMDRWSLPMNGEYRMSMSDLCTAVRNLNSRGILCGRIDSGGNPTWALTKK